MKIVLATPLYPPDIAEPALYVKELARRLAKQHELIIVTYAHTPEIVPGVNIITVDKRQPRALRLFRYTLALFWATLRADVIYAQNGASVELPVGLVVLITGKPLVARMGDISAHARAGESASLGLIERFFLKRARTQVDHSPLPRPEILPLENPPVAELDAYEASWNTHLKVLEKTFTHV